MNTCDLSHNNMSDHTHQNILWSADPVLLYDKVITVFISNKPKCQALPVKVKKSSFFFKAYVTHRIPVLWIP